MLSTGIVGVRAGIKSARIGPRASVRSFVRSQLPVLASRSQGPLSRNVQTQSLPPSAGEDILNSQRLKRPSSPHFTIYQPQLTWVGSIANRITGGGLSIALYAFAISYLAFPVVGIPMDSATIVDVVHQLPEWAKYSAKAIFAFPFAYHSFNGVRHLLWDMGRFLTVKGCYRTGYAVLGLTAIGGTALLFM